MERTISNLTVAKPHPQKARSKPICHRKYSGLRFPYPPNKSGGLLWPIIINALHRMM
jgi:hypothetical protein